MVAQHNGVLGFAGLGVLGLGAQGLGFLGSVQGSGPGLGSAWFSCGLGLRVLLVWA